MSGDFDGLVAAVTGGASGIGAAIAAELVRGGARVAVLDLQTEDVAEPLVGLPLRRGRRRLGPGRRSRASVDHFGRLDIVVNNAGIGAQGTVADNADEEWQRVLDINVIGMVRVTRAALPHLRASRRRRWSTPARSRPRRDCRSGRSTAPPRAPCSSLTQAMAADHLREGIRVNCVNPGTADTPWVGRLLDSAADPAAERRALEARQPHGRLVTAEEVAGAVAYLASPRAGSTTGVALAVDGGMQALRLRPPGQ